MKLMSSGGIWLVLLAWCLVGNALAAGDAKITRLKKLYLDTSLVEDGKPQAIIAAPPGSRYEEAVNVVQEAILKCAGVKLPVVRDEAQTAKPEELLKTQSVIALGNMATNPFTEHMYRQWYVLLDLCYPGPKGHVVRSLHNPYGTGHNVIWLGGSDDEGVLSAARVFADGLRAEKPGNLKVGWLMKIKLGEGVTPPRLALERGEGIGDVVYSWRDSFRKRPDGRSTGYAPSTYFGWNPISIAGALYYMTGRHEYLEHFKALAMPDPENIPEPNRTDDAFNDPMNPLVMNYHYRAHLVDCVYDLIEESPLFTDEERLLITNKLLDHQRLAIWGEKLEPWSVSDKFRSYNASRHTMWHMLCIYTGSRYFGKYYPHPRWKKRMQNIRESFGSFIGDPTWGELDTLGWVSTSTEPVFEFFMLDGFEEFVSSGTARTMISAMETLWTGTQFDESNSSLPISLLHKAAYMLKDGRYIWLRDRLGFDLNQFRIGQSFWPSPDLGIKPPEDIAGKICTFPLPKANWERSGKTVPLEEGFQFLAYRAGLTPEDDLIQIDGFYGKARTPYHVNSLYTLRMSGGKRVFHRAYANQISIRSNGMVEPTVPRAAALKRAVALGDAIYLRTSVPNMAFSTWDRHLIYVPDSYAILLDEVTPRQAGAFDITIQWAPQGTPAQDKKDPRRSVCPNGPVIQCGSVMHIACARNSVSQTYSGQLCEGEMQTVSNIVYWSDDENELNFTIDTVGPRANVIHGTHDAFVAIGEFGSDALSTDAEMAYVSGERIFLVRGSRLTCNRVEIMRSDKPVSLQWDIKAKGVTVEADGECRIILASTNGAAVDLKKTSDVALSAEAMESISEALAAMRQQIKEAPDVQPEPEPSVKADWHPSWEVNLPDGMVTKLAVAPLHNPRVIWASTCDQLPTSMYAGLWHKPTTTASLSLIALDGEMKKSVKLDAPAYTLWPAADTIQEQAFCVLAGLRNDIIRAYSDSGATLWEQKAEVHPSFKIGDRYNAPWFSDPRPPRNNRGVFAIMVGDFWGTGSQDIALSRPVTLEFRRLDGTLIERVPTRWGDNTTLALLSKRGGGEKSHLVLTGKFVSGHARISAVDENYNVISDSMYGSIPRGSTDMTAWSQRGISHLSVADLDGDGVEEVIVVRSGHWNELGVYSGKDQRLCIWGASFGPDSKYSRFMTGLVVADLSGDGKKEIAAGMANGWVCIFDSVGEPIWQHHFSSAVTVMCKTDAPLSIAVGCADGFVYLMDGAGRIIKVARLSSSVTALSSGRGFLLAGTQTGKLIRLPLDR